MLGYFNIKDDSPYLLFLLTFSCALTFILIDFHLKRGAFNSDVYIYLSNALTFAGLNVNNISDPSWLSTSTFLCFLISILFRLGYVNITSGFIITGILSIWGNIGFYILLKQRFSPILSLTGSILYSSFSLTLFWWANSMNDSSAVAITIWIILFTILAIEHNPKFYIIASILFILGIFTRGTVAFVFFLMIFYFIIGINSIKDNFGYKKQIKYLSISILISVILFSMFYFSIKYFGSDLNFLHLASNSIDSQAGKADFSYHPDYLFYIKDFLKYLFCEKIVFNKIQKDFINPTPLSYLISFIFLFGLFRKLLKINFKKIVEFKSRNIEKFLKIFSICLLILSFLVFSINYLISIGLLLIAFILISLILSHYSFDKFNTSLILLNILWILIYLSFISFVTIKVNRYFLPILPPFVFFVILALEELNFKSKNKNKIIPIILIILLCFTAFNFTNTVVINQEGIAITEASEFLINYDNHYKDKNITSFNNRYFEWYLNKDLNNFVYENPNYSNQDYIIYDSKLSNMDNYNLIFKSQNIHIYEKVN